MTTAKAKFHVGQLIHHKLFDYRGVVVDVDLEFSNSEEWYRHVARTCPPKDQPWYHVLVDCSDMQTYVAERNLEPDDDGGPINHPEIARYFAILNDSGYVPRSKGN
jgi:heat shock protein HspQ